MDSPLPCIVPPVSRWTLESTLMIQIPHRILRSKNTRKHDNAPPAAAVYYVSCFCPPSCYVVVLERLRHSLCLLETIELQRNKEHVVPSEYFRCDQNVGNLCF